jgi:hypothetical protein
VAFHAAQSATARPIRLDGLAYADTDKGRGLRAGWRARSKARWVTEQNSKKKQPKCKQGGLVMSNRQTDKAPTDTVLLVGSIFVLIGTYNG